MIIIKRIFVVSLFAFTLSPLALAMQFTNCNKVSISGTCLDATQPVISAFDQQGRLIFKSQCQVFSQDGKSCEKWLSLQDYTYNGATLVKKGYGRFITNEGYFQDYVADDLVYHYQTVKQCSSANPDGSCIPFHTMQGSDVMVNIHFKDKNGKAAHRYCKEIDILPDGKCTKYVSGRVPDSKDRPEAWRICGKYDDTGEKCLKYNLVQFVKRNYAKQEGALLRCKPETISKDGNSCTKYKSSWWHYAYESTSPNARATAYKHCSGDTPINKNGRCSKYTCNIYKYENNVQSSHEESCSKVEPIIRKYIMELNALKAKNNK